MADVSFHVRACEPFPVNLMRVFMPLRSSSKYVLLAAYILTICTHIINYPVCSSILLHLRNIGQCRLAGDGCAAGWGNGVWSASAARAPLGLQLSPRTASYDPRPALSCQTSRRAALRSRQNSILLASATTATDPNWPGRCFWRGGHCGTDKWLNICGCSCRRPPRRLRCVV